ncbi:M28 family metallopeptidase [Novosphingobium piscinae]|uniref:M28 family peptidase n=1 Tax=Novosphingobium piscinae TaxID=1507448 RepID=A0A7X1FXK1_9SPHN|nr:M28 family metallopeptidase [Novosphingobium piscinae]MBC2668871.1 M28 family peptidase [Novosphingobium piscinae]
MTHGRKVVGWLLTAALTPACLAQERPAASAAHAQADAARGARIWDFTRTISADSFEGRGTGTPGYDRAAALVARELEALGLKPAGDRGYFQPVAFLSQRVLAAESSVALTGPGGTSQFALPTEAFLTGRHAYPASLADVPLVFAGYGLSMPGTGHDDFAAVEVRGKIVVVIAGGPGAISGARKAHARAERNRQLAARGALGLITLTTAKQIEIPWARAIGLSARPAVMLRDPAARDVGGAFFSAQVSPEASERLFAGSAHSYAELAVLADASAALPRFDLAQRLSATVKTTSTPLTSANLVAVLPGRDPRLAREHVVVSAHLDGLGVGEPVDGDAIYNGTLDNGIGVASVLEIARDLSRARQRPRRSVLFLIPTAEEAGLLGSRYFATHPTVPRTGLIADINFDMPLPIFPLRTVTPIGYEESTLGEAATTVAARFGLPVVPDPLPDRNVFIRSDQYSFIRAGVPSLFMKFGFAKDTPEAAVERAWRANLYHSPKDDPAQPVMPAEIGTFTRYVSALVRTVADAPARPAWHARSIFAKPGS